jgi:hypothetical protein
MTDKTPMIVTITGVKGNPLARRWIIHGKVCEQEHWMDRSYNYQADPGKIRHYTPEARQILLGTHSLSGIIKAELNFNVLTLTGQEYVVDWPGIEVAVDEVLARALNVPLDNHHKTSRRQQLSNRISRTKVARNLTGYAHSLQAVRHPAEIDLIPLVDDPIEAKLLALKGECTTSPGRFELIKPYLAASKGPLAIEP